MKIIPDIHKPDASEFEEIIARHKTIDGPLFFDSKANSPYKWPVFFLYAGIVVASLWFLLQFYSGPKLPQTRLRDWMFGGSISGVLVGIPAGIYYLLNLIFPAKLLIEKIGITLSKCGRERSVIWTDVKSITIQNVSRGKYDKPVLWIIVRGTSSTLKCPPYFGIDPNKMLQFLDYQRNAATL